jgi:dTDP-4-dehydrorhamnose reductase
VGAGGLLGRTLVRALGGRAHGVTHADLDITSRTSVRDVVAAVRPAAVVNCAAMTNVDACEAEPERAWAVNAEGAAHVAAAAAEAGAEVVHVSTDYVFDGRTGNYAEDDDTNPLQAYGRAKLAGEDLVRTANERHYVVRSAWIYGRGGKNFVSQIPSLVERREAIRAVADQRSSPTFARDLAAALAALLGSRRYGTYHVVNEGSCSYAEFAEHIASTAGGGVPVTGVSAADVPRPAPRPADTSLVGPAWAAAGFSPLRAWRRAAEEFWDDVHSGRSA